jgi:hypothetical protein
VAAGDAHPRHETHILVRSKLIAMGLSVASLVVQKGLVVHPDRASFEQAYVKALRAKPGSPRQ